MEGGRVWPRKKKSPVEGEATRPVVLASEGPLLVKTTTPHLPLCRRCLSLTMVVCTRMLGGDSYMQKALHSSLPSQDTMAPQIGSATYSILQRDSMSKGNREHLLSSSFIVCQWCPLISGSAYLTGDSELFTVFFSPFGGYFIINILFLVSVSVCYSLTFLYRYVWMYNIKKKISFVFKMSCQLSCIKTIF